MLKDLEFLYRYMTKRKAAARISERLSESDDYVLGYLAAMDEVLSALADLIEEYRTEDHDDE